MLKKTLPILLLVLLFINIANAHVWTPTTDVSFGYNECNGYASISVLHFFSDCGTCDDDYITHAEFYYEQNGAWVHFGSVGSSDGDCAPPGTTAAAPGAFQGARSGSCDGRANVNFHTPIPLAVLSSGSFRLRVTGNAADDATPDTNFDWISGTISVPAVPAPQAAPTVTTTICDYVNVTWQPASNLPPCLKKNPPDITLTNNVITLVYRDGAHIATYPYDATEHKDYGATGSHIYGVRHSYYYSAGRYKEGPLQSSSSGGFKKPVPVKPTNLSASLTNCNATVNLSWNVPGATSYRLRRSGLQVYEGSNANYTDSGNGFQRGINYTYTVSAMNECGWGPYSDGVNGYSPPDPSIPSGISAVFQSPKTIRVSWSATPNATSYSVERSLLGGAGSTILDVPNGALSILDSGIDYCQQYEYRVIAYNQCRVNPNGVRSTTFATGSATPVLTSVFAPNALSASKGFYSTYVELRWALSGTNSNLVNAHKIYRRELGNTATPTLIATLNSGSNVYPDNSALAGKMYEYFITAEAQCEGSTIYSNTVSSIGYRIPFGTVTGNVSYDGGNAVKDVRINAISSDNVTGSSLSFNGASSGASYLRVGDKVNQDVSDKLIVETWLKPNSYNSSMDLVNRIGSYKLSYDHSDGYYKFVLNNDNTLSVKVHRDSIPVGQWTHIACQLNVNTAQIYINGREVNSTVFGSTVSLNNAASDIYLFDIYKGLAADIRIWKTAKSSFQINRDHSRLLLGNEPGLILYLKANEPGGNYAYDGSYDVNTFNENHALFNGTVVRSTDYPTLSQLSLAAYTNANGNYTLKIPYRGEGESFDLTPQLLDHSFNPSVRSITIGDNATLHNNQDFIDKSAFEWTGSVFYKNSTCAVQGATIKIDGAAALNPSGIPVVTDANGEFRVDVPIGNHYIEVAQNGHVYSVGRFENDFQEPNSGIQFIDSTLIKVVGRVVGGLREGNKKPGFGLSKNNIGVARVVLTSTQGNGCSLDTLFTDPLTGEYSTELPPLKYNANIKVLNNPIIFNGVTLDQVDLSAALTLETEYDTIIHANGTKTIREVKYHKRLDYIHKEVAKISVKGPDGIRDFIGDTTYTYIHKPSNTSTVINLRTHPFNWPVFTQHDGNFIYRCMIKVYEEYQNFDPGFESLDSVPTTDGVLKINNELSHLQNAQVELSKVNDPDTLKSLVYSFKPGTPNFTTNQTISEYSFTKKFQIEYVAPSGDAIPWTPVVPSRPGLDNVYRAYLLGGVSTGTQWVTEGPQIPEYILRDPPGSNSYAERVVGTEKSESTSWNWNLGGAVHTKDDIYTGQKFTAGVGVSQATEIENNITAGFKAEISGGNSGSQKIVTENTSTWSTNSNSDLPGRGSDLYIGKSKNIQFGIAEHLIIVPDSIRNKVEELGTAGANYIFSRNYGLSVVPGGFQTNFIFNENHIKNYLIKDLKNLRKALLESNSKYSCVVCNPNDPKYGLNNDDPKFGMAVSTNTPRQSEYADLSGPSYIYHAVNLQDSLSGDSVRYVNEQIYHWEDAIRLNEWEKVNINKRSVIDSLEKRELEILENKYELVNAGYIALVATNAASGLVVAYGLIATPVPGTAFAGYATFAVTTAAGIGLAELEEEHNTYLNLKQRIKNKYGLARARITSPVNYSISGGAKFTSSLSHTTATSNTKSIDYTMTADMTLAIKGKISNNGVGFEKGIQMSFTSGRDWSDEESSTQTISYTLDDPDEGNYFSVDAYPSILGYGPIFKKRAGGQTSCPYEGVEVTEYSLPLGDTISSETRQIDVPSISVTPSIVTNVPSDEKAVFTLTLGNETFTGLPRQYSVQLVSTSNPYGAIVSIDGASNAVNLPFIPARTQTQKTLAVAKGAGPVYNYDSLLVVIYAPCQYGGGTNDTPDIVDSVYISVHFIPSCTDVSMATPEDQWVLNNSFNDTLPVAMIDYNINTFDLNRLRLEYKPADEPNWIGLQSFWKDTSGRNDASILQLPRTTPFQLYDWDVSQITDGVYDMRVISECAGANNSSPIHRGYMDRINPHAFGTPSPGDGILDPNDDIQLNMNETVEIGSVTKLNFDVRGVLNGTALRHETSLFFDGANDHASITDYQLQKRSLTIEFWVKRASTGEEVILSQGSNSKDQLLVSFDSNNKLRFELGDQAITSVSPIADTEWHHVAISYNRQERIVEIFIGFALDRNVGNFVTEYNSTGPISIAKHLAGSMKMFSGSIHELRLWNTPRIQTQIVAFGNKSLSGRESGLIGNWPLNEAYGTIAYDKVRSRHAFITGATWSILPQNHSFMLDGVDDYLQVPNAGTLTFNPETNLTFEAWFKTSAVKNQTIFSNGKADGTDNNHFAWNIYLNSQGAVVIENDGTSISSPIGLNDNDWHHVSVVIERTRAVFIYIDGDLVVTDNADIFKGFGATQLTLGARAWRQGGMNFKDYFFEGKLDEIRIWNSARQPEQIARDFLHQLEGNELGLQAYYPFDGVKTVAGILLRDPNRLDASDNSYNLTGGSPDAYSTDAPPVKLPRIISKVNFNYSINNDKIIIEVTDPPARVENVTLDITVSGIKDLAGNVMQSPETWIAYINKNQVFWQDEYFALTKKQEGTLQFKSKIVNSGGSQERFNLSNLPVWMNASPFSGIIEPNSTVEVTFTISEYLNIGEYEQDIFVATESFGFNERLLIDLKVYADPPDWTIDPSQYLSSMSYIGQIVVNDLISIDPEDILIATIRDTIRGIGNVKFSSGSGKYLVFLDIYGGKFDNIKSDDGDSISFKIWDASENKIHPYVTPDMEVYAAGALRGTPSNPINFTASDYEEIMYSLKAGWNWISFPLVGPSLKSLNSAFQDLNLVLSDRITNHRESASYISDSVGWTGNKNIVNDSLSIKDGYRLYVSHADTFIYRGIFEDPKNHPISLIKGWNSIGMISEDIIDVSTALSNLNPQDGDWIKGQTSFAVYEERFGWTGSLKFLKPREAYMIQVTNSEDLIYPNIRSLKSKTHKLRIEDDLYNEYNVHPEEHIHSMNIVASINGFNGWDKSNVWYIAAFHGDECRGINEISKDSRREKRLSYLNTYGTDGDSLHFRLISQDKSLEIDLNETYVILADGTLGVPSTPEIFSITDNPCSENLTVLGDYTSFLNNEGTIQARQRISINSKLNGYSNLILKSGQSIELLTGFEIPLGSTIQLFIQDCNQ